LTQKAATDTTRDLRSKVHRQTPGHRSVSLFWHEKGRMIFDTFQILGLLWASYGAWPASWLLATQWTTLFAGDVLSFTEYHSAAVTALPLPTNWSEAKASYWALYLPVVCIGVPLLLYCLPRCCCCCATSPSAALSYVVRLAELMYLPIVLCLLELGTCRGRIDQWTFPNDALSCWGWFGTTVEMSGGGGGSGGSTVWYVYLYVYAIPVFSLMVALVFLLWVPLRINKYIDVLHVYTDSRQHERYINAKELEYLLYINTDYEDEHFSTVTSFKRECFNNNDNNDNNDKHTGHKWFGAGAGGVFSFFCFFLVWCSRPCHPSTHATSLFEISFNPRSRGFGRLQFTHLDHGGVGGCTFVVGHCTNIVPSVPSMVQQRDTPQFDVDARGVVGHGCSSATGHVCRTHLGRDHCPDSCGGVHYR
jgi:hypothetical protein